MYPIYILIIVVAAVVYAEINMFVVGVGDVIISDSVVVFHALIIVANDVVLVVVNVVAGDVVLGVVVVTVESYEQYILFVKMLTFEIFN